jgi:hypothetical protein
MEVTMAIIVYHGMAWVFIHSSFTAETVALDPMRFDDLVDTLTQAAKKPRNDKNS